MDKRLPIARSTLSFLTKSAYGRQVEANRQYWYRRVGAAAKRMVTADADAVWKAMKQSKAGSGDFSVLAKEAIDDRRGEWKTFLSTTYKVVGSDFASRWYKRQNKSSYTPALGLKYSFEDDDSLADIDTEEWFGEEDGDYDEWMFAGLGYVDTVSGTKAEMILDTRKSQVDRSVDKLGELPAVDMEDKWYDTFLLGLLYNADFIGVSEVSLASNVGGWMAATRAMFDTGAELQHEWCTVHDDRVRDAHSDMDGVTIPFSEPFRVPSKYGYDLMMFPGDVSLGAGPYNIVNCRCTQRIF